MTDLSLICGLPIKLDEDTNNIFYGETVAFEKQKEVPLSEITPVLLNKFLRYPEKVYKQYNNVYFLKDKEINERKISYDVIQIPYGLLGIEFVKTHVFFSDFSVNKYACMVEVIRGELTVLIQRNAPIDEYLPATFVDEIDIIHMEEGEKLAIPTGVFYTFVNSGSTNVIFAMVTSREKEPVDYSVLAKEKGLAFYIISKNARLEVVANPKYKLNCCANRVDMSSPDEDDREKFQPDFMCDDDEPLYNLFQKYFNKIEEVIYS